jgi:hypothetical protein
MRKQAGAAQKWARIMCRLGRALVKEVQREGEKKIQTAVPQSFDKTKQMRDQAICIFKRKI